MLAIWTLAVVWPAMRLLGRGFPQNEYRGENFVFGGRTLKMKNAPEFGGKEFV